MTATIKDIIKGKLIIHNRQAAIRAAKQRNYLITIPNKDPKVMQRIIDRNHKIALKDYKDILKCEKLRETESYSKEHRIKFNIDLTAGIADSDQGK